MDQEIFQPTDQNFPPNINTAQTCNSNNNTTTYISPSITTTTNLQANKLALNQDQNLFRKFIHKPVNSTSSTPTITHIFSTSLTNQHL
jgi:hypothetical protein